MAHIIHRCALNGRFVEGAITKLRPHATTTEMVGRGGNRAVFRSAITGQFIKEAIAKRHPGTTIRQAVR